MKRKVFWSLGLVLLGIFLTFAFMWILAKRNLDISVEVPEGIDVRVVEERLMQEKIQHSYHILIEKEDLESVQSILSSIDSNLSHQ